MGLKYLTTVTEAVHADELQDAVLFSLETGIKCLPDPFLGSPEVALPALRHAWKTSQLGEASDGAPSRDT